MCDSDATIINYKMTSITAEEMHRDMNSSHTNFRRTLLQDDLDTDAELDNEVSEATASAVTNDPSIVANLSTRPSSRGGPPIIFPEHIERGSNLNTLSIFSDKKDHVCVKFTLPDGSIETGIKHGDNVFWSGECTMEYGSRYSGDLSDGMRDGFGCLTRPDGYVYRGFWLNNKRHGEGDETLPDGTNYDGDWANDRKHGWGMTSYLDGTEHKGDWRNGEKNGWGRIVYGTGNRRLKGRIYTGHWKMDGNNLYGKGEILYPNGDTYNGEWLNDMRHGRGIHKATDGNIYIGAWENDVAVFGDVIYPDGTKMIGLHWKNMARVLNAL